MVFISATRLRLRSPLYLPAFLWNNALATWQIVNTPGFLGGQLLSDSKQAFWTLTAWEEPAAMKFYRNSGAHGKVMRRIQDWCDEASVVHWQQEDSNLPNWEEAHCRIVAEGYATKLSKPSPAHLTRKIPEPQSSLGLPLSPRRKNAEASA